MFGMIAVWRSVPLRRLTVKRPPSEIEAKPQLWPGWMDHIRMRAYGIIGRALGLLVFLAGATMLAGVFYLGFQIFQDPGFSTGNSTGDKATSAAALIVPHLTVLLVRLAFLLAMCIAASLMASKGIQLYVAGVSGAHPPVVSNAGGSGPVVLTRKKIKSEVDAEPVVD